MYPCFVTFQLTPENAFTAAWLSCMNIHVYKINKNVITELKEKSLIKFPIVFSNSLIIHQVKTKKITTVKEVWIPGVK